jgi:hypothetical protein
MTASGTATVPEQAQFEAETPTATRGSSTGLA